MTPTTINNIQGTPAKIILGFATVGIIVTIIKVSDTVRARKDRKE